jgi:colicin import membrane protein
MTQLEDMIAELDTITARNKEALAKKALDIQIAKEAKDKADKEERAAKAAADSAAKKAKEAAEKAAAKKKADDAKKAKAAAEAEANRIKTGLATLDKNSAQYIALRKDYVNQRVNKANQELEEETSKAAEAAIVALEKRQK